jgi:hypothetical protein
MRPPEAFERKQGWRMSRAGDVVENLATGERAVVRVAQSTPRAGI